MIGGQGCLRCGCGKDVRQWCLAAHPHPDICCACATAPPRASENSYRCSRCGATAFNHLCPGQPPPCIKCGKRAKLDDQGRCANCSPFAFTCPECGSNNAAHICRGAMRGMTSAQIMATEPNRDHMYVFVREIAYQLAVMNERRGSIFAMAEWSMPQACLHKVVRWELSGTMPHGTCTICGASVDWTSR